MVQGFGCSSGVGTNSVTNTLRGFATPVGRSPRGCVDTLVRYWALAAAACCPTASTTRGLAFAEQVCRPPVVLKGQPARG